MSIFLLSNKSINWLIEDLHPFNRILCTHQVCLLRVKKDFIPAARLAQPYVLYVYVCHECFACARECFYVFAMYVYVRMGMPNTMHRGQKDVFVYKISQKAGEVLRHESLDKNTCVYMHKMKTDARGGTHEFDNATCAPESRATAVNKYKVLCRLPGSVCGHKLICERTSRCIGTSTHVLSEKVFACQRGGGFKVESKPCVRNHGC